MRCTIPVLAALASTDSQHWKSVTVNVALPDNFKVSSETVPRTGDARGLYEVEENAMIGRKHRFRQQVNFDNVLTLGLTASL